MLCSIIWCCLKRVRKDLSENLGIVGCFDAIDNVQLTVSILLQDENCQSLFEDFLWQSRVESLTWASVLHNLWTLPELIDGALFKLQNRKLSLLVENLMNNITATRIAILWMRQSEQKKTKRKFASLLLSLHPNRINKANSKRLLRCVMSYCRSPSTCKIA